MADRCFIVAEAGVNHNGELDLARKLIDAAAEAGADAVKFQIFQTNRLVVPSAERASYQVRNLGGEGAQQDMLEALELKPDEFADLKAHAEATGIQFLATPFDPGSLAYLTDELGLDVIKIGSGDLTNGPLILQAARKAKRLILSTGMAEFEDVAKALAVAAFGFDAEHGSPPVHELATGADSGRFGRYSDRLILLHCLSAYPGPAEEMNLRAIPELQKLSGVPTGFSDHSEGIALAPAAVALGAVMIEKHLTLDRRLKGPDHSASLEPGDFATMVRHIREVEAGLGDGVKRVMPSEKDTRAVARRSVVAASRISSGEEFNEDNLDLRRPADGLSPMDYWTLLGRRARRAYAEDDLILSDELDS